MDNPNQPLPPQNNLTQPSPAVPQPPMPSSSVGVTPGNKESAPVSAGVATENLIHTPETAPAISPEVAPYVEKVPDAPALDQSHQQAGIQLAASHTPVFTQQTAVKLPDGSMDLAEAQRILQTDKDIKKGKSWIAKLVTIMFSKGTNSQ